MLLLLRNKAARTPYVPDATPGWLPTADGTNPTIYADPANGYYWSSGTSQASESAWLTDVSATFTRATSAYSYDATGLLTSKSSGVLRKDYDPSTATFWTNTALQSETFDNATWTKATVSVSANSTTAPDGNTTADTLVEDSSTSYHTIQQSGLSFSAIMTFSLYAKAKENDHVTLLVYGSGGKRAAASFDLTNIDVRTTFTQSGYTLTSTNITDVGSGWRRCEIRVTPDATAVSVVAIACDDGTTAITDQGPSYTGDGSSGVYIWGAQAESGSSANTYVPTTTTKLASGSGATARGWLLEGARTNILTYSEQFDNAAWTNSANTVTANAAIAPTGTLVAESVVPTSTNTANHYLRKSSLTTTAATWSASVYAKANGYNFIEIFAQGASGYVGQMFNLSTGAVASQRNSVLTGTGSIVDAGNGWYRCTLMIGMDATAAALYQISVFPTDSVAAYAGDTTSGVYLYGAQFEAGSFASSYIATTTASVTRNADVFALSSFGGTGPATHYAQFEIENYYRNGARVIGANTNVTPIYMQASNSTIANYSTTAITASLAGTAVLTPRKAAAAYAASSERKIVGDGGTVTTSATTFAGYTTMYLGSYNGADEFLYGHILEIGVWDGLEATDSAMQSITT